MIVQNFYDELLNKFKKIVIKNGLMSERIRITGKILKPEEAIGNPIRQDYPILKGKEKLIEADFKGAKGQAFTNMPGQFSGTLEEIIHKPLKTNFDRAVLISTINAVCKYLNIVDKTIHCKDEEPERCSKKLVKYIKENYGFPKVALIGFQPAMLEKLSKNFEIRVADLDEDNIGKVKYGIEIEDGRIYIEKILNWCDVIIATGSTIANSTITVFLNNKPVIFYGTTIAGVAKIMDLNHFCECSK